MAFFPRFENDRDAYRWRNTLPWIFMKVFFKKVRGTNGFSSIDRGLSLSIFVLLDVNLVWFFPFLSRERERFTKCVRARPRSSRPGRCYFMDSRGSWINSLLVFSLVEVATSYPLAGICTRRLLGRTRMFAIVPVYGSRVPARSGCKVSAGQGIITLAARRKKKYFIATFHGGREWKY